MSKDKIIIARKTHIYEYYLKIFVESKVERFKGLLLNEIYCKITSDGKILDEFLGFLNQKLLELCYSQHERNKVKEAFLSELN